MADTEKKTKALKAPKAPKAAKAPKAPKAPKAAKAAKAPKQGALKLPGNYKPQGTGHFTDKGTQKWQANGPIDWRAAFVKLAGSGAPTGNGVRNAMAYAVAHLEAATKWARAQEGKAE